MKPPLFFISKEQKLAIHLKPLYNMEDAMNGWGNERMEALWIYFLMILLAGILSLVLCIFSYLKLRNAPGGRFYTIVTLLSAIFSFAYALELSSHTLQEIKFWLGIEYLVMPFIPSFILEGKYSKICRMV